MSDLEIYDKAKYHYEGDYPSSLPKSQAYVHTGFFVGWVTDKGMLSVQINEDFSEEIETFKKRQIRASDLYRLLGGILDGTMLNREGNQFAKYYFDFETGNYVRDYQELFTHRLPSFYHVEDNWGNYGAIATRIDDRYAQWKQNKIVH